MADALKRESIIDNWGIVVEEGVGRGQWVLNTTEEALKKASMPNVSYSQKQVTSGGFLTASHEFLIVNHKALREYQMYIYARDYGTNLDAGWYLTFEPRGLKWALSRSVANDPKASCNALGIFSQRDLNAFTTITHHCLKQTLENLYEELKLNPVGLNTQSKGFLSVW